MGKTTKQPKKQQNPWGRVAAVVAFCITVIGGLIAQLDPFTIFCRAGCAITLATVAASMLTILTKSS